MKLDELFDDNAIIDRAIRSIEDATGWTAARPNRKEELKRQIAETKQKIAEFNLPVSDAEQRMKFWIKAHLTQLNNSGIKEVPLSSVAKELNTVANEMGFASVDPNEPDMLINLINGDDDKEKLGFIDTIDAGTIKFKGNKEDHDRKVGELRQKAEKNHVKNMATNAAKSAVKDKGKSL